MMGGGVPRRTPAWVRVTAACLRFIKRHGGGGGGGGGGGSPHGSEAYSRPTASITQAFVRSRERAQLKQKTELL